MSRIIELFQPLMAAPEVVWAALSTPEGLSRWQADAARWCNADHTRLELAWPELDARVELEVEHSRPGRRIRFRSRGGVSDLKLAGEGVRLRHDGGLAAADDLGLRASWAAALRVLSHSLRAHPGRSRSVSWHVRPVRCARSAVHEFCASRSQLGRWLCRDGELPAEGDEYRLQLRSGMQLTGRVLARVPGADVLLSVASADEATLHVRSLPGPSAGVRRVAVCWSQWRGPLSRAIARELDLAVERLARELAADHAPRLPFESLH